MEFTICTVCLESIDKSKNNYCIGVCNHLFHLDCLLSVTKNNKYQKCPLCGYYLTEPDIDENNNDNNNNNDNDDNYYVEENNLDCYGDEAIIISDILDFVIANLIDSKFKSKLVDIQYLIDNNLLIECNTNINSNNNLIDEFSELCYKYDCDYNIESDLMIYLLKIKKYLNDILFE